MQLPNSESEMREKFAEVYPYSIEAFDELINFEKVFSPTVDYGAIFHYTSVETCKIILQNRTIRFTNISFLNDSQEYLHSLAILNRIIQKISEINPEEALLNDCLQRIYRELASVPPIYVACFSRDHDKLSQWRGYTPGKAGACIAFDSLDMSTAGIEFFPLYDVIYDTDRQIDLITRSLEIVGQIYFKFRSNTDISKYMDSIVKIMTLQLKIVLAVTKKSVWSEENEVRMLIDLNSSSNLKHLRHDPPRTIDIKIHKGNTVPILGVTLGPGADTEENISGITDLLSSSAFKGHSLHRSEIPLR